MIKLELDLVRENPQWLTVLEAYHTASEQLDEPTADPGSAATSAEDSAADSGKSDTAEDPVANCSSRRVPWLRRFNRIEGLDADQLSKAHGRMIAYGLLQCDLPNQSAGVVYRLTSTGRQVLAQLSGEAVREAEQAA
ncbi:MAG: hypothetical protein VB858_05800 [Planctomycetaceae bacterium]|jgi:hypothetical protein